MKYTPEDIEQINKICKKYTASDYVYPSFLLISNFLALFVCIYLLNLFKNSKLIIFFVLLTSLMIVRNFMVFHDMGHASFFPSNERETKEVGINKTICKSLDFIFFYSGKSWIDGHSKHHEVHGNIDIIDIGRTLLSSEQYENLPYIWKKVYDIIHYPVLFFILFPLYVFYIGHFVNCDIVYIFKHILFLFSIQKLLGTKTMFYTIISYYIASIIGVILFHLQHSMNEPSWYKINSENDKQNADINGSYVLQIPFWLKPFTNGIEYHNVHHIDPAIPSYNIQKCYEELRNKKMLNNHEYSLNEMFNALFHTMYDTKSNKYVYHYNK